MNKKHYIIIQESIIEDIEKIISLPDEYKSKIKELCLSDDILNITLANEILKTLDKDIVLVMDLYDSGNRSPFIKDPSRISTIIPYEYI